MGKARQREEYEDQSGFFFLIFKSASHDIEGEKGLSYSRSSISAFSFFFFFFPFSTGIVLTQVSSEEQTDI